MTEEIDPTKIDPSTIENADVRARIVRVLGYIEQAREEKQNLEQERQRLLEERDRLKSQSDTQATGHSSAAYTRAPKKNKHRTGRG